MAKKRKPQRLWLCLMPVQMTVGGEEITHLPEESVHLLAVYKTKKAGRAVHGPEAQFIELEQKL